MRKLSKKRWLLVGFICLLIIAVASFIWAKTNEPNDLGPELTYIGKKDFGCFVFWCDSKPYSEYYFATNLSKADIDTYFKDAKLVQNIDGASGSYTYNQLHFKTTKGVDFWLIYYNAKSDTLLPTAKSVHQTNTISITDHDYHLAQSAL